MLPTCTLPSEKGGRGLLLYAHFSVSMGSKLEVKGFFFSIFWICITLWKAKVARCLASDLGIMYMVIFSLLKKLKLLILNSNKATITTKLIRCSSVGFNCFENLRFTQWKKSIHLTRAGNSMIQRKAKVIETLRGGCNRTFKWSFGTSAEHIQPETCLSIWNVCRIASISKQISLHIRC